jgi:integrase/recombinase XerD
MMVIMNANYELKTSNYKKMLLEYSMMMRALEYKQKSKMYDKAVQEFLWFLESIQRYNIRKVNQSNLVSYYEYISTRPNIRKEGTLSSSTINTHMLAVNILFDYLVESKQLSARVVLPKHKNENIRPRDILTVEEVMELYKSCVNKRDVAFISIAYGCGLRRTEIENLNVADVQLSQGVIIVRNGKNNKRREIPLSDKIITHLRSYLYDERTGYLSDDNTFVYEDAFLINNRGSRFTGAALNGRLKQIIELTGSMSIQSKVLSMHNLRHSIAVHLLDNNASLEFVKDFLGHSEIDTVHVYTKRRKMKQLLIKNITR